MYQKLFKSGFVESNLKKLKKGENIRLYKRRVFPYKEDDLLSNKRIKIKNIPSLKIPNGNSYDFENAVCLFETYKNLDRVQATDIRMWTYMAHVQYWDYMKARWPINVGESKEKLIRHIANHWFVQNSKSLSRHGIATLWWGAFLTYDKSRDDSYELTKEFFSYTEYRRQLLERVLGRYKNFTHAFLEFVIENESLFKKNKENRIRFLMKAVNLVAGYRVISALSKEEIKKILSNYKNAVAQVWGRAN